MKRCQYWVLVKRYSLTFETNDLNYKKIDYVGKDFLKCRRSKREKIIHRKRHSSS